MRNPTTSVQSAIRSRWNRRRTSAMPRAAIGTNSGPSTIAPMMRICESSTMAIAAMSVAKHMKLR